MNHLQRYLTEEFKEEYEEGRLSRRDALKMIASVTGSLLLANSILAACMPPPEETQTATATDEADTATPMSVEPDATLSPTSPAEPSAYGTVMPDDPAVIASEIEIPSDTPPLLGYLARPASGESAPVVLVCHENRGLTPHIQDVTRRFAKAGYVALAVDLVSRQGGSAAIGESGVSGVLGNIEPEQFVADFLSGWHYLQGQSFAQAERVGMVGFCFGGGITWLMAARMPELRAAVPFYGPPPPLEEVPNIQAPVLAVYGGQDARITGTIPSIEPAMQENGKVYEKVIYPDADHAFHNDTTTRYNPEAAKDAWAQTLAWFETYL
jgi:carboxymethylenebutenolidase